MWQDRSVTLTDLARDPGAALVIADLENRGWTILGGAAVPLDLPALLAEKDGSRVLVVVKTALAPDRVGGLTQAEHGAMSLWARKERRWDIWVARIRTPGLFEATLGLEYLSLCEGHAGCTGTRPAEAS